MQSFSGPYFPAFRLNMERYAVENSRMSRLNQKRRNKCHLKNLSSSKLNHPLGQKNDSLLFEKWTLSRQLMSAYTKPTLERQLKYLLALISRSNLAFVKSRWTFTPFFNSFLFLENIVRWRNAVKRTITVSSVLLTRCERSMQASGILILALLNKHLTASRICQKIHFLVYSCF